MITTIFSTDLCVTTVTPSSPLSSAPSDMTPPSAMTVLAPWARDDDLTPCSDSSRPPCGCDRNSFPPCAYYGKQNNRAKKCWRQFGKSPSAQAVVAPLATLSLAFPGTPTPHYHVTLTSAGYDALHRSKSIDASSSSRLDLLLALSTLDTFDHLASYSPSWIINSGGFLSYDWDFLPPIIISPDPLDGYYVAYKTIKLSYILFMFIEMKFIHCHSCVMFAMKSMSMCNDYVNYDEIII